MNILIIKKNFHPNTIGIVKALMNNNHSVSMIVHKKRGIEDHYNILEPQLIGYNRFSRFLLPLMSDKALDNFGIPKLITLAKAIKALKPKIIIIYQMKLSSIFSILIGKLMGSKLILLTETPTNKDSKINRFFSIIKLLPQNQIRVAGTGEIGSIHYFNFKPFKTLTMPYPIYPTDKNEKKKTMNKKIISIGSFDNPRKKQWLILDAIRQLDIDDIEIILIGFGSEKSPNVQECEEIINKYKLKNKISYIYNLKHFEINEYLSQADLFILPSSNEPYGVVIPEAIYFGLPVICSSSCGAKNCIYEGINGFIFKTDSSYDLGVKIKTLIQNPDLLQKFSLNSIKIYNNYISSESWYKAFENEFLN